MFLSASVLLVGLLVGRSGSVKPTSECSCGYGGVCLRDVDGGSEVAKVPCDVCNEISGGFYDDCSEIVDHCRGLPCENGGTCRSTWGSYYCDCRPDYFGQKCDIHELSLIGAHLSNQVFIYHQIQPDAHGVNWIDIIYDPGHPHKNHGIEIRPKVTFSDDRVYYPARGKEFVLKNVRQRCLDYAKTNEGLYDERICELVPEGEVWTLALDATLYSVHPEYTVVSVAKWGLIGLVATVRFEVDVFTQSGASHSLFNETYKIFTYRQQRLPNKCDIQITFRGCSSDKLLAQRHSRAQPVKVQAIRKVRSCRGAMSLGYSWYAQRNVLRDDKYAYDGFPKLIVHRQPEDFIEVPKYQFEAGLHMITFSYILRGDPPNYGSRKEFQIFAYCWVQIIQNTPWFEIKGGAEQTASCYLPLKLKIQLMEPSSRISEYKFTTTCDDPSDSECAERTLASYLLKKVITYCNRTYNYTIVASHKKNHVPDVVFSATIAFAHMDAKMTVECLSNCYRMPIDPANRVLVAAQSEPHISGRVEWRVYKNREKVTKRDGKFDDVFSKSTASRIIRVNGLRFTDPNDPAPSVSFHIKKLGKELHHRVIKMLSKSDNLRTFRKYFNIIKGSENGYYSYSKSVDAPDYVWRPVRYRIYNVFEKFGVFVIKADTTFERRLIFKSSSSTSVLCLLDSYLIEDCHDEQSVDFVREELTIEDCARALRSGDFLKFMERAVIFLTNNLYQPGDTFMEWKIPVEDQIRLIDLLDKAGTHEQHAAMQLINLLNMIFYSEAGCEDLDMEHPFIDRVLDNYQVLNKFFELKTKAKRILRRRILLFDEYSSEHDYKLLRTPVGDPLQLIVRGWTLIYLGDLPFKPDDPSDFATLYIIGEITHWFERSVHSTLHLMLDISPSMGRLSRLFEGIRTIGSRKARTWMTRCTYKCILTNLDKSKPVTENLTGYVAKFFEDEDKGVNWLDLLRLDFPGISATAWELEIISMVVWVAKSRPKDRNWTPVIYVEIRSNHGDDDNNLIKYFPNGLTYNISLPPMVDGELIKPEKQFYSEYIIEQPEDSNQRQRHFVVFKITYPIIVSNFTVFFLRNNQIKGIVTREDIPEYSEVIQSPEWELHAVSLGNLSGFSYTKILQSEDLSNVMYLAMTLSESEPPGIYKFFLESIYVVCQVLDLFSGDKRCERLQGDEGTVTTIKCRCKQIGFVYGRPFPVSNFRLLVDDILLTFPQPRRLSGPTIGAIMIIFTAALVLIAWFLEKKREAKGSFLFLDYEYPADTYRMLIGVQTGMNVFSGTWSNVAIRLFGRSGSSRVIVLRTRTRKVLTWASDYWFLVSISASLGPLTHIMIFHDFRYLSDWYCSHMMIYDNQTSQWYYVAVQRWFEIYPSDDDSRMVILPVAEFNELEEDLEEIEYSFNSYYFKELRNTHLPFSMFSLHYRSVATYEQKFLLYLVKLMTVVLIAWGLQDFGLPWLLVQLDLTADNLTTISWDTMGIITAIALITRIFTFPLSILYRWVLRSGLLLSKTTSRRSRSRSRSYITQPTEAGRHESDVSQVVKFTNESTKTSLLDQRKSGLSDVRAEPRTSDLRIKNKKVSVSLPPLNPGLQRKSTSDSIRPFVYRQRARGSFLGQERSCSTVVLGPTLFRSVNVSPSVFKVRSRMNTWQARCSVSFLALLMMTYFFYEELLYERPHYWNRAHVFFFFLLMALLIDTVVLEPFFIFTKSLLAYVVFEMSNNDLNLWNPTSRIDVTVPRGVTWEEYLEKATQKEYKPISSSNLSMKRKHQHQIRILQLSILYICMIGMAYNCYEQLTGAYIDIQYVYKEAMKTSVVEPAGELVNGSIGTEDVHSSKDLLKYMITNFVVQTFTWRNEKPISLKNKFWDKTRYSIPLGSTNMIVLLMSASEGSLSVPKYLVEYFEYPITFYSRLSQETNPVYLDSSEWTYQAVSNWSSIKGRSGNDYPFKGHTSVVSLRSWPNYYSDLRHKAETIVKGSMGTDIIPRAIIYTTNYFSPNIPGVSTVDLVVEFLPSGLRTVKIYVHLTKIYGIHRGILYSSGGTGHPTNIFRIVSGFLLIVLLLFNVCVILKIGVRAYLTDFHWIIRALFLVSCFLNSMSSAFLLDFKYSKAQELLQDVEKEFVDVHDMYDISSLYDKLFLGLVFFFLCMEAMSLIHSLMSSERLARVFTKCMALTFSLTIIEAGVGTVYQLTHYDYDRRTLPLLPFINLKQMFPAIQDNRLYSDGCLSVLIIVLVYLSRLSTGFAIQRYNLGPDAQFPVWIGVRNDFVRHLHNEGICKRHTVLRWLKSKTDLPAGNHELRSPKIKPPDSAKPNTTTEPTTKPTTTEPTTKPTTTQPTTKPTTTQPQQKKMDVLEGKFSILKEK